MTEAEKRIRAAVGVLDPAVLEAARKELDSAFIDCTLHAQVAIHVGRYLRSCSPENIAALLAEIDRLTRERDEAQAARDAMAKDEKRLDWLDAQCSQGNGRHIVCLSGALRAAIDNQMEWEPLAQIEQERSEQAKEEA